MNTHFKKLFALCIMENPDGYIAKELFHLYPNLQELLDITEEELLTIKSIGKGKAQQIIAALQLARFNPISVAYQFKISTPNDVYEYLVDMQYLDREHFVLLGLSTKNTVIFKETISIGSLNSSLVHPREVFKPAIRRSCAAVILVHNHPSGIPDPSNEDIQVTKRLYEAGKLLGVEVLDHIIVGHGSFQSLKELGIV